MDEVDYLFISKVLFLGRTWVTQTYVFSSNIPFYLLGIGEKLAGLLGARVISLIFGGFSITAFYFFVRDLLEDKKEALFSTLFLASQASFIFLSKFATYDIFCFFMLSLWSGVRFYKQDKLSWGIFSAVAFVLAVLCKYVVIIYLPFIGGLFLLAKGKKALPLVGVVATLLLSYFLIYKTDLTILYKIQIVGSHKSNSSEFEIWKIFFKYMFLPLVIVFYGKVLKSLEGIKKKLLLVFISFSFTDFYVPFKKS